MVGLSTYAFPGPTPVGGATEKPLWLKLFLNLTPSPGSWPSSLNVQRLFGS